MEDTLPSYEHAIPFQTLIGTVKSLPLIVSDRAPVMFQTLIGTVKSHPDGSVTEPKIAFQTLIGTVKRGCSGDGEATLQTSFKPS